ncbi:14709_t:CDS:2 [Acaulospora colombiana]|uniref:14709_t:CDS:1 n=1 Tax=Acaulospora colombiana TaxID=27376 RepID=A0ACA9M2M9_9GLOM|nr:14709_t:CDS:2 [Acaulospora colombiana]
MRPLSSISTSSSKSFKVIRHQRQRKSRKRNVLNPTLDNFYNILRRTHADQSVKSARSWANEYEKYRKSVILDEIRADNIESSGGIDSVELLRSYFVKKPYAVHVQHIAEKDSGQCFQFDFTQNIIGRAKD